MACRICTANDEEALIEDLARAMWESTRERDELIERFVPWEDASIMWQTRFRAWARDMRAVALREAA